MKLQEVFAKKTYGPDSNPERSETGEVIHDGYFVKIYDSDTKQQIQRELDELRGRMDELDQSEFEEAEYEEDVLQRLVSQLTNFGWDKYSDGK